MHERLLDKTNKPTVEFIESYLGEKSYGLLLSFEKFLSDNYQMAREMKFPFGNEYGWGYKYSHKKAHICYVFFESGAFSVQLQLGDKLVPAIKELLPTLLPKTQEYWETRYPCGDMGGWIEYQVLNEQELEDVIELVKIKKKPVNSK
jgi:hypothetical protein